MVSYDERIDEICRILANQFGVRDREVIELLLLSRLECDYPYPWIVYETDCNDVDCQSAWFSFGKFVPVSTFTYRLNRPRWANVGIQDVLSRRDEPKLFIEPQFTEPPNIHANVKLWPILMQECVRIRGPYPRYKLVTHTDLQTLEAATSKVLDMRWRQKKSHEVTIPAPLIYYLELLQRLSPYCKSWDALLSNMCSIVFRRAVLYNRDVLEEDWQFLNRIIKDTIPLWISEVLTCIARRMNIYNLRKRYPAPLIKAEGRRLVKEGITEWRPVLHEWALVDPKHKGVDVMEMVKGELQITVV